MISNFIVNGIIITIIVGDKTPMGNLHVEDEVFTRYMVDADMDKAKARENMREILEENAPEIEGVTDGV